MLYLIICGFISYIFYVGYSGPDSITLSLNPFDIYEFRIKKEYCTTFDDWDSRHVFIEVTTDTDKYGPFNSNNRILNISFETKDYIIKASNEGPNIENLKLYFTYQLNDNGNDIYPFNYIGTIENPYQIYIYIMVGVLFGILIIYYFIYGCCCNKWLW